MKVNPAKGLGTDNQVDKDATDYEAHGFHRTLMDAEEIKNDPEKMARVHKIAGVKSKAATAIKNIADIKMAAKKMRKDAQTAAQQGKSEGRAPVGGVPDNDKDGM